MHTSILVVDDFYNAPYEVRDVALGFQYPEPKEAPNFPGRNSIERLLVKGLEEIVSDLVSEKVVAAPQTAHGHCRISLAADDPNRRFYVHVDHQAYWSGIVYLSRPEDCQGGTEFFRHRELGTDRCPIFPDEVAEYGVKTFGEAAYKILEKDSNDASRWDLLMTVPMRFNRLVLLRPWLWHTAGLSFGDTLENGRLIQLFFFTLANQR
ncbi:MAG TPA: DUF6445 family protein [Alphaproteobacteria bacterium]|nr:DUF6445 family protein [Alphaproteobacteria bacterium]